MSGNDDKDLTSVMILWLVLNGVLILYAFGLFIYAKYYRKNDTNKVVKQFHNLFLKDSGKFKRFSKYWNKRRIKN